MRAAIRGTELYFDVAGMQLAPVQGDFQARAILFLLHGGPGGDHLRYKQHSLTLQDVAQLVFIDNRGCGRSKKTNPQEYTLENNIEDIEALRQYLGLEQICILGTSYGGMVAQGYAIRYPQNIEKLILVATSPSYRFLEQAKINLKQRGTAKQIEMAEYLWNGSFQSENQVKMFLEVMDSLYSVSLKKSTKELPKSKTIWSYEALNKGFSDFLRYFDFIPKLKQIICPTLILAGENDWISSPDQAKTLAENIPNSQLKMFKNCGHLVATDCNEEYIQAIKNFLL